MSATKTKLITDHQSGFRPKDSTVNQLAFLYHTFCQAIDSKKEMRIVFCDVSKAFDKVWHEGLLYKLSSIGICGHLLRWFRDYLCKRQQRVLVRGQSSDWGTIEAGVPQGSVLCPLLFLIYVNDMVKKVSCGVKLFADDTLMYITMDNPELTTVDLNRNMDKLNQCAQQWLVNFNATKTKTMNISFKNESILDNYPVIFGNEVLNTVSHHRHLGMIINESLIGSHIFDTTLESVGKLCDVFIKLKRLIDRKTLIDAYFAFVRPKLVYACIVWDDCSDTDKTRLEDMQLRFARAGTGAKRGTSHQNIYNEICGPPFV